MGEQHGESDGAEPVEWEESVGELPPLEGSGRIGGMGGRETGRTGATGRRPFGLILYFNPYIH